jgi:arylsulfate sulfotransferase
MKISNKGSLCAAVLLAVLSSPAWATVKIVYMRSSLAAPQSVGTTITWTVRASDTNSGPLAFQFQVAPPGGSFAVVKDFDAGSLKTGAWVSSAFNWNPQSCSNQIAPSGVMAYTCAPVEGTYKVQVVVKDFASGESVSRTARYQINPLVTGSNPVVIGTANTLVALFSSPACPSGSTMRVSFQEQSLANPATTTNWMNCNSSATMNFEIAGMYPSTAYQMFSQTKTGSNIVNGPTLNFTTGALPGNLPFPKYNVVVPAGSSTDTTDAILLLSVSRLSGSPAYPDIASDLAGNLLWYNNQAGSTQDLLTRPLANGTFLVIENGAPWSPHSPPGPSTRQQFLRQVDLAGSVLRETNVGAIEQELLNLGATDAQPCAEVPVPAPVGDACLGGFHHDAIQTLANGYTAVIADVEKIFPVGTQNNSSGLPVDIIGDFIIVLDNNWQAVWYFDTFDHDMGAPQLDINRAAVLGETCVDNQSGCPPIHLLSSGTAPKANDWLHANSLYYWPSDSQTSTTGDIIWSSRHQDWVMKVDYHDGGGSGDILWRLGNEGDFSFNNLNNNRWPWFSHQHEVGMENSGAGPLTIFDNGNTRVSAPPLGLGKKCKPNDCHSRGMVLNVNEISMQATPVMSQDLGYYSNAMGSAQLLSNGNYFFMPAIVILNINSTASFSEEYLPTPGHITGTQVLNIQGPESYRGWQMLSLYNPPTT